MKRRARIGLVLAGIAAGVGAVYLLTAMSSAAGGPIAAGLQRAGALVGSIEHRVRARIRGPGRAAGLAWLDRSNIGYLKNPDSVLLGAYDGRLPASLDGVIDLESQIGVTLPLIQLYAAWGDEPEHQFPLVMANAVWSIGSVPMITWEPWLTEFDGRRRTYLPLREARDNHGLAAIARGDYDFYVDEWAESAARFGRPLYLRFAHEMNDPYRYPWGPQNNTKEEFVAAWRRVVTRFRAAGATNVIWVWSPHVAYEYWDLYYPGAGTVDWVATGVLNFGPIAQWSRWWTFDEIFGTKYQTLAAFGKPVMIAEFGSLAVGGDRAVWYTDALSDLPASYPAVKSLLFFETGSDQTVTYQKVDWRIAADTTVAAAVAQAVASWAPSSKGTR
ncbi:MAG: glycoside hydrolase family 26 protein [Gemmatimonadaceae bacterium]